MNNVKASKSQPAIGRISRRKLAIAMGLSIAAPTTWLVPMREAEAIVPLLARIFLGRAIRRGAVRALTRRSAAAAGSRQARGTLSARLASEAAIFGAYSALTPGSSAAASTPLVTESPMRVMANTPAPAELLWEFGTVRPLTVEVRNTGARSVDSTLELELVNLSNGLRKGFLSLPFAVAGSGTFEFTLELIAPTTAGRYRIEGHSRKGMVKVAPSPDFRATHG